ncbi:hypothetical protein HH308_06515 [Gordonia sp. TBRC 11910]|uniref:HTH cro/C1-type domain-containing protein n=2 Tax=Gordonia asplenii TaxID=2725283 RepID=A0A848KVH3_9ACTN|nr:hypothetical protein [Gordonia asplenii]
MNTAVDDRPTIKRVRRNAPPPEIFALNDNIRAELARRKMTQGDLASGLRTTQQAVARRLNGQTPWTVAELVRVARIVHSTPARLLEATA